MICLCRCFIVIIFFLFNSGKSFAQSLTGTWEGIMGMEHLQVNIVQKKNELCGYTFDYNINNPRDHCKAFFKGWYDEDRDMWILVGTSFIENSGSHVLMQVKLWKNSQAGNVLNGTVDSKDGAVSLLNWRSGEPVRLRKVPTDPAIRAGYLSLCFPKKNIQKIPAEKKNSPVTNKAVPKAKKNDTAKKPTSKPVYTPTAKIVQKEDTLKKRIRQPVTTPTIKQENAILIKEMKSRKKTEFSHLQVSVKDITLSVYDNGIVDNDTVSIFYNGKLLAGKKLLSEKPHVIRLKLDENIPLHEITMFAENLGSIPPNTALIVVNAGDKRYELHSKASLEENAVLVFEYKPKKDD